MVTNLVRQWAAWGLRVDLLQVRGHGPHIAEPPANLRLLDLGARHVLSALPALVRYLRRERPVALLSDKDRVNRTAILARSLARSRSRLVVRLGTTLSRNLESRGPVERWVQRRSVRWLYRQADRLLVPSQGVADDLADHTGFPSEQISVVRSPIVTQSLAEQALLQPGHPWFADPSAPVILGVGELGYRKDFETLIRAFARLRARRPCRLIILGRGRRRERLESLARELGVDDDLDLPGFESNPYAFMARADLFVLSSRWEGMPVALVEALACRTPVVSTDCPSGPREVLEGRSVGELVPVEDDQAMAGAMEAMLDRRVPAAALDAAVAEYRVGRSAAAYLRVLGLERPGAGGTAGA